MNTRTLWAAAALFALALGGVRGQVGIGEKAPVPDADRILTGKVKSLSELSGRLIIYEFFAHW